MGPLGRAKSMDESCSRPKTPPNQLNDADFNVYSSIRNARRRSPSTSYRSMADNVRDAAAARKAAAPPTPAPAPEAAAAAAPAVAD
ncbi:hypothetical protein M885DRAFT_570599 [Pelagophyceae sp. CCMP2097]|nr:hypothetical protein M885DRAFT_570599 [Pelagophyceae sp. CCMP2097]